MKIIYNNTQDAKVASVVLYQKFVLNFGIDMNWSDFIMVNSPEDLTNIKIREGEYICLIGIPATFTLSSDFITVNILDLDCKILYINNETDPVENMTELLMDIDLVDHKSSLILITDQYLSLSMLVWMVSRYKAGDDIAKLFSEKRYSLTSQYEYLVYDEDPDYKISIPWLIRFITDFVCGDENEIPETEDFHYGLETIMDLPSNHINWERLLSDDKEVMQLMNLGVPIRNYADRIRRSIEQEINEKLMSNHIPEQKYNWLQRVAKKLFKI